MPHSEALPKSNDINLPGLHNHRAAELETLEQRCRCRLPVRPVIPAFLCAVAAQFCEDLLSDCAGPLPAHLR